MPKLAETFQWWNDETCEFAARHHTMRKMALKRSNGENLVAKFYRDKLHLSTMALPNKKLAYIWKEVAKHSQKQEMRKFW